MAVVPVAEALAELLTAEEVAGITTDALYAGARNELRGAAADMAFGRAASGLPQILEDVTAMERNAGMVDSNLGNAGRVAEKENAALMGDVMKDPTKLTAAMGEASANAGSKGWASFKSFVGWSASEIWKGGLFYVGMEAAERIVRGGGTPLPRSEGPRVTDLLSTLNKVVKELNAMTTDWHQWCVDHFAKKATYGILTVEGARQFRFELFRGQLSGLSDLVDTKLAPALAAATKGGNVAKYLALRDELAAYAGEVHRVGQAVKDKEGLMVKDGLKDHLAELDDILARLKRTSGA